MKTTHGQQGRSGSSATRPSDLGRYGRRRQTRLVVRSRSRRARSHSGSAFDMTSGLRHKLRPTYIRAGLLASGTASDVRRLRLGLLKWRARLNRSHHGQCSRSSLRILAHLPTYAHTHGGAESSMQTTLAFMRDCGHEPRVIVDQGPAGSYEIAEIEVTVRPSRRQERALYSSADVVITQGRSSVRSFMRAAEFNKPLAFFVRDLGEWKRLPGQPELVVFNSEWQRQMLGYSGPAIVVRPPIDAAKYLTTPGHRVTLINLNKRKGGDLFGEIVVRMPDVDFLGVVGMWEEQIVPAEIPHNLEILESRDDVREIYSRTRVLLLPSEWESFGRVAVEAGLSGIPVVASPNPGTLEALGDAAIYAGWSDVDEWIRAIRSLEDPDFYATKSAAVVQAARRFATSEELVTLEATLKGIAS